MLWLSQDLVAWANEIYRLGLDAMQLHRNSKYMPASPCQRCIVSRDDDWRRGNERYICELCALLRLSWHHAACWIHAPLSFLFVSIPLVYTPPLNFHPLSVFLFSFHFLCLHKHVIFLFILSSSSRCCCLVVFVEKFVKKFQIRTYVNYMTRIVCLCETDVGTDGKQQHEVFNPGYSRASSSNSVTPPVTQPPPPMTAINGSTSLRSR